MHKWIVKQIFDGEYGCEERQPGEKVKCYVLLTDAEGNERSLYAEDEWLTANNIDEGSAWPETCDEPNQNMSERNDL